MAPRMNANPAALRLSGSAAGKQLSANPAAPRRRMTGNALDAIFAGVTGMFDALSLYTSGQEASSQAAFRARQARQSARDIMRDTEDAAAATARGIREYTGSQRTAIAKSGVALTGSAELALAESEQVGAMELIALRHRGKLAEIEAQLEAESAAVESKFASRIGTLQAGATLLSSVGQYQRIKLGG